MCSDCCISCFCKTFTKDPFIFLYVLSNSTVRALTLDKKLQICSRCWICICLKMTEYLCVCVDIYEATSYVVCMRLPVFYFIFSLHTLPLSGTLFRLWLRSLFTLFYRFCSFCAFAITRCFARKKLEWIHCCIPTCPLSQEHSLPLHTTSNMSELRLLTLSHSVGLL